MSTATERVEVFQDTLDWIEKDPDLSASVNNAKKNTEVFYEDDYPVFDPSREKEMTIRVSGDRSYQAAMRLHKENPDAKIAVMNFANAFHAGGGVTQGSSAQEECLCRTSTLFFTLDTDENWRRFYNPHRRAKSPLHNDDILYAEGITVFKSDTAVPETLPESDWYEVDVMSCAAPNLRERPSNLYNPGDGETRIKLPAGEWLAKPETGALCIDTGCGKGGCLTAMILEEGRYRLECAGQG